jgi:hypothetical protein
MPPALRTKPLAYLLVLVVLIGLVGVGFAQTGVWKDYCFINVRCSQTSCRAQVPFNKCTYDPCAYNYHKVTYNSATTTVTEMVYSDANCNKFQYSIENYVSACYNQGYSWMFKLVN